MSRDKRISKEGNISKERKAANRNLIRVIKEFVKIPRKNNQEAFEKALQSIDNALANGADPNCRIGTSNNNMSIANYMNGKKGKWSGDALDALRKRGGYTKGDCAQRKERPHITKAAAKRKREDAIRRRRAAKEAWQKGCC